VEILQFNVSHLQTTSSGSGTLLHFSLVDPQFEDKDKISNSETPEISVGVSPPEVRIDPAAGHNAGLPPYITSIPSRQASPGSTTLQGVAFTPADSLMFNNPWLWACSSQAADTEDVNCLDSVAAVGNVEEFSSWWNINILQNITPLL
jgi:hypothetical protein